jgi:hypothetical protein
MKISTFNKNSILYVILLSLSILIVSPANSHTSSNSTVCEVGQPQNCR